MAAGGIVLERHRDEDRLLRLPITYDNAINDPRTNADTIRSLELENKSAVILAENGFDVVQNPAVPGPKNPDYLVNGEVFDAYAPSTDRVRNVAKAMQNKVDKGQTNNVVVNLKDSAVTAAELQNQLTQYPISGLQQVLVIDKTGAIVPLKVGGR